MHAVESQKLRHRKLGHVAVLWSRLSEKVLQEWPKRTPVFCQSCEMDCLLCVVQGAVRGGHGDWLLLPDLIQRAPSHLCKFPDIYRQRHCRCSVVHGARGGNAHVRGICPAELSKGGQFRE